MILAIKSPFLLDYNLCMGGGGGNSVLAIVKSPVLVYQLIHIRHKYSFHTNK